MIRGEDVGQRTREQLIKFGANWNQGDHVLVSAPTNAGKTFLTSKLVENRLRRRGYVVVFVGKLQPDETLLNEYKGWTRWTQWKRRPGPNENRILLWPKTASVRGKDNKMKLQKTVFTQAFEDLLEVGRWTVQLDETLYMVSPEFLNLGSWVSVLHQMGRSAKLTMVSLMQRPSNVPIVVYGSAAHAFVGRTAGEEDRKRLSEINGAYDVRELSQRIASQSLHDFTWLQAGTDNPPERVNVLR